MEILKINSSSKHLPLGFSASPRLTPFGGNESKTGVPERRLKAKTEKGT